MPARSRWTRCKSIAANIPLALRILAALTFITLFLMTGSVVLPIKALLMNVLTISATFGVLVLIFQDGRFEGLLDYTSQGALESSQPVFLFAVVFGLSTDYAVFLLTRIKEARDAGAGERESVALGLQRTGRIVTAAALLFAIALGAFATSQIIFIKELGIGTALAVLIDATIVRAHARAVADGAARAEELVGAEAAAPAARPDRHQRRRSRRARPRRRLTPIRPRSGRALHPSGRARAPSLREGDSHRRVSLEVGDHGEHAAVVLSSSAARSSFMKMLLVCLLMAFSVTNSAAAIAALERPSAISAEHLPLAVGQPRRCGLSGRAPGDQRRDDLGVEHRAAGGDRAHGVDERRRRRRRGP